MKRASMKRQSGFSLVELIVVIVLVGIIGGVLALQLVPAIQGYLLVSQRANMTNQADSALRRMTSEVRGAVPNSLRLNDARCLDLVPTSDGGRYRTAPDTGDGAVQAAWINEAESGDVFDTLTPLRPTTRAGDAIVIGNRSPADVYSEANVAVINSIDNPAPPVRAGVSRIRLDRSIQVPPGYDGARFVVVPGNERVVTYLCSGVGKDTAGTGTGQLLRIARAGFGAATSCTAQDGAAIVASRVAECSFVVYTNQGATQDSGYVQLQLTLSDKGESVPLTIGTHVDNLP